MFIQKYSLNIELGFVFTATFEMKMFRANQSPVTHPRREKFKFKAWFSKVYG